MNKYDHLLRTTYAERILVRSRENCVRFLISIKYHQALLEMLLLANFEQNSSWFFSLPSPPLPSPPLSCFFDRTRRILHFDEYTYNLKSCFIFFGISGKLFSNISCGLTSWDAYSLFFNILKFCIWYVGASIKYEYIYVYYIFFIFNLDYIFIIGKSNANWERLKINKIRT